MKFVAISGSHRTGKSTLAQEICRQSMCYTYLKTDASGTFARLGMDPKADYPLLERLEIQNELLTDMEALYEKASIFTVTDRSPLDLMSYMLADVSRAAVRTPEEDQAILDYMDRCRRSLMRYFNVVFLLQPGIPVIEAPGKAPGIKSYMEHINSIACGLLMGIGGNFIGYIVGRHTLDLQERVDRCLKIMSELPLPAGWVQPEQKLPS